MPFGITDALALGGGLINTISGSDAEDRARQLQEQMMGINMADFEARLPLRGMAIDRLLAPQPQRENLNAMFDDPGNPYQRDMVRSAPLPMPSGGSGSVGAGVGSRGSALLTPATGSSLPLSMGDQYINTVKPQLPSGQRASAISSMQRAGVQPGKGLAGRYLEAVQRNQRGY